MQSSLKLIIQTKHRVYLIEKKQHETVKDFFIYFQFNLFFSDLHLLQVVGSTYQVLTISYVAFKLCIKHILFKVTASTNKRRWSLQHNTVQYTL